MDALPTDLCLKVFGWLDHQNLAAAQLVCRKWRDLASEDTLWSNLFKERWGVDMAEFYAPVNSKSWKDIYIVQDRCVCFGPGLKIIREGDEYLLIHQGEIQRHLGSRRAEPQPLNYEDDNAQGEARPPSILDKIIFFIGDMEAASVHGKRSRFL